VGGIGRVSEVEEVVVVADLDVAPSLEVEVDHVLRDGGIIGAKDARRPNRHRQQRALGGLAVGFEDELLGRGFCFRVVLSLELAADDGEAFVGVDEIRRVVTDDACAACVDEGLDTVVLARCHDVLGSLNVDLAEQLVCHGALLLRVR